MIRSYAHKREIFVKNASFSSWLYHLLICPFVSEGPIWRTREGGSEWEPIKILLEGDGNSNKMNTASNMRTMCGSRTGGWLLPCVMSD
jgi:hypothetical protein